jgi:hypothetical protein
MRGKDSGDSGQKKGSEGKKELSKNFKDRDSSAGDYSL